MSEGVWLAVLAAVVAPCILAWLNGRMRTAELREQAALRREEKQEDWRRQDEVARRAQEVAEQLLEKQKETVEHTEEAAHLLVENNKVVAKTARETNSKLDVIHTLVNSNMTAALQDQLDETKARIVVLKEVIALRVDAGKAPDPDALGVLAAAEEKAQKLGADLRDRLEQTKVADAQIFIAKEQAVEDEA